MKMTGRVAEPVKTSGKIIDFHEFRKRKAEEEYLARGRKPLYVSHSRGQVRGQQGELSDFSGRIATLRMSIEKINALMTDLKKFSASDLTGLGKN